MAGFGDRTLCLAGLVMRAVLLIIWVALFAACERGEIEEPWYGADIEFGDIGVKREMFYLLTRTIGDCGFKVIDNPVVRRADGGKASFHYFVTQNQDVAADLHDMRGHTKLSINLFLSGFIDKRHAEECWNAVQATLQASGHQVAP